MTNSLTRDALKSLASTPRTRKSFKDELIRNYLDTCALDDTVGISKSSPNRSISKKVTSRKPVVNSLRDKSGALADVKKDKKKTTISAKATMINDQKMSNDISADQANIIIDEIRPEDSVTYLERFLEPEETESKTAAPLTRKTKLSKADKRKPLADIGNLAHPPENPAKGLKKYSSKRKYPKEDKESAGKKKKSERTTLKPLDITKPKLGIFSRGRRSKKLSLKNAFDEDQFFESKPESVADKVNSLSQLSLSDRKEVLKESKQKIIPKTKESEITVQEEINETNDIFGKLNDDTVIPFKTLWENLQTDPSHDYMPTAYDGPADTVFLLPEQSESLKQIETNNELSKDIFGEEELEMYKLFRQCSRSNSKGPRKFRFMDIDHFPSSGNGILDDRVIIDLPEPVNDDHETFDQQSEQFFTPVEYCTEADDEYEIDHEDDLQLESPRNQKNKLTADIGLYKNELAVDKHYLWRKRKL